MENFVVYTHAVVGIMCGRKMCGTAAVESFRQHNDKRSCRKPNTRAHQVQMVQKYSQKPTNIILLFNKRILIQNSMQYIRTFYSALLATRRSTHKIYIKSYEHSRIRQHMHTIHACYCSASGCCSMCEAR